MDLQNFLVNHLKVVLFAVLSDFALLVVECVIVVYLQFQLDRYLSLIVVNSDIVKDWVLQYLSCTASEEWVKLEHSLQYLFQLRPNMLQIVKVMIGLAIDIFDQSFYIVLSIFCLNKGQIHAVSLSELGQNKL